jgi:hypothetical protein
MRAGAMAAERSIFLAIGILVGFVGGLVASEVLLADRWQLHGELNWANGQGVWRLNTRSGQVDHCFLPDKNNPAEDSCKPVPNFSPE